jgi:UDP-glucuronate 4-epimerase
MQADATGIFNLGSGRRITVNELIKVIEKITDRKTIKKHIEKQKGDVSDTWADVKKARKTFNYKPKIKIKEGVEIFYKWFEKNVVSNNTNIQ